MCLSKSGESCSSLYTPSSRHGLTTRTVIQNVVIKTRCSAVMLTQQFDDLESWVCRDTCCEEMKRPEYRIESDIYFRATSLALEYDWMTKEQSLEHVIFTEPLLHGAIKWLSESVS